MNGEIPNDKAKEWAFGLEESGHADADSDSQWGEFVARLLDAVHFGMDAGAIAYLLHRTECAEHAATLFRLAGAGFESDAISGKRAREARYITAAVRDAVFEREGHKCRYCGCEHGPFHIDHIVPVSRGGGNTLSNLAVACAPCNLSKSDKLLSEWGGRNG